MRREEICQLRARHVVTDAKTGIAFFDLRAPGLKLKNVDSKRWVLLHRDLSEMGFVPDHVAGKAPDEALFPELEGQKRGPNVPCRNEAHDEDARKELHPEY